jgi:hypothetical protein
VRQNAEAGAKVLFSQIADERRAGGNRDAVVTALPLVLHIRDDRNPSP